MVRAEKPKKQTNVPSTPNMSMVLIFAKKLPLYILKPDANTIGGRHTKKNVLSLNFISSMISSLLFSQHM